VSSIRNRARVAVTKLDSLPNLPKHFGKRALWLSSIRESILSILNGGIDKRCELSVVCIAAYIMQDARIRRLLRSIIQSLVNICLLNTRKREREKERDAAKDGKRKGAGSMAQLNGNRNRRARSSSASRRRSLRKAGILERESRCVRAGRPLCKRSGCKCA